jgi:uncharacterized protein YbjT (DUF2867 family)
MALRYFVIGGTGKLGRLVVARLLAQRLDVVVLARRPTEARTFLGPTVTIVEGDLANPSEVGALLSRGDRVFLLSPIAENVVSLQTSLVTAAAAVGVERVVKISGSDWTFRPPGASFSGSAHQAIEDALASSGIPHVAIRPNAWMQGALGQIVEQAIAGSIPWPYGDAAIDYIDANDIADVAVSMLTADRLPEGPLVLTGSEALGGEGLARIAAKIVGVSVQVRALTPAEHAAELSESGVAPFRQRIIGEFANLMRTGAAARTTTTVRDILGRPPRRVEEFLMEQWRNRRLRVTHAD